MIRKRIATSFALGALVLVAAAPTVSASGSPGGDDKAKGHHRPFVIEMVPVDFFYGFDGGYVLFTGATPEDLCYDTPPPLAPAKVFERRDGTFTVKARAIKGVDLFLYEFDGPAPALVGATCEALFDGDPDTNPLQPMAVGTGTERLTIRGTEGPDDIGGFHVANSARGTVKATDGTRWKVRGHASFDVGEDGIPIGEPSDFQGLRVRQIGHRS